MSEIPVGDQAQEGNEYGADSIRVLGARGGSQATGIHR